MNIISLEGRLSELETLKKSLEDKTGYHKFDIRIHRIKLQLKGLTSDKFPKDLIEEMVFKSL